MTVLLLSALAIVVFAFGRAMLSYGRRVGYALAGSRVLCRGHCLLVGVPGLADLVDRDDVLVVQLGDGLGLAEEAPDCFLRRLAAAGYRPARWAEHSNRMDPVVRGRRARAGFLPCRADPNQVPQADRR